MPAADQLEKMQRLDHDTLIRVETKMDSLTVEMRQNNTSAVAKAADHEARIRVLEVDKDRTVGSITGTDRVKSTLFAIIGVLIGVVSAYAIFATGFHK